MGTCECMCMFNCRYMCVPIQCICTCVCRSENFDLGSFSSAKTLRQCFLLTWSSWWKLDWLTSKLQGSTCLYRLTSGIIGAHCLSWNGTQVFICLSALLTVPSLLLLNTIVVSQFHCNTSRRKELKNNLCLVWTTKPNMSLFKIPRWEMLNKWASLLPSPRS